MHKKNQREMGIASLGSAEKIREGAKGAHVAGI